MKETQTNAGAELGASYEKLGLTKELNAIFVTSGSVVLRPTKDGEPRYSATSFNEKDVRGFPMWGNARVLAAKQVGEDFPDSTIVALSRADALPQSAAEVMANRIKNELGAENEVEAYDAPIDTFSELISAAKMAIDRGWKEIAIMVGEFQKPRAQAMLDSIMHTEEESERKKIEQMLNFNEGRLPRVEFDARKKDFDSFRESYEVIKKEHTKLNEIKIILVAAEDVLTMHGPRFAKIVETAQKDPKYIEQKERDKGAAEQWRRGEYGIRKK